MMDGALPLLRYVCVKEGLYPSSPEDAYEAERIIDAIFYECRIDTEEIHNYETIQEQVRFMIAKCQQEVPGYLSRIDSLCGDNIQRTFFVVNDSFTIADVVLITWLSSVIGNPTRLQ